MSAGGTAVAAVRLCLDVDCWDDEDAATPALAMFNELVADLDLETAKATVAELAVLATGLLHGLRDRHDIDPDEMVAGWGLRLAQETP